MQSLHVHYFINYFFWFWQKNKYLAFLCHSLVLFVFYATTTTIENFMNGSPKMQANLR
jgi:hypothetical protein